MNRYFIALFISIFTHLFLVWLFFYISDNRNEVKIILNKEKVVSVSLKSYQKIKSSVAEKTFKSRDKEPQRVVKKKKKVIQQKKLISKKVVKTISKIVKPIKRKTQIKKIPVKKQRGKIVKKKPKEEKKRVIDKDIQKKLKSIQKRDTISQKQQLSAQKVYMNENLEKIRVLIQDNLYYPRSARRRGIIGKVVISLILSKSSKIKSLNVLSSQHNILSRAAIKTIRSIEDDFPTPKEEMKLEIPIVYSLE